MKRASEIGPHFSPTDKKRSSVKPTLLVATDAEPKLVGTLKLDHAIIVDGLHMLASRSAWGFDFPGFSHPSVDYAVFGGVSSPNPHERA